MSSGVFPSCDCFNVPWPSGSWRQKVAGTPIAEQYTGWFSAVTHDSKARYQTHGFRSYYNCNYICEICPAAQHIQRLSYANARDDAPWRGYALNHAAYLAATALDSLSPWCRVPGFSLDRALLDYMHCFHLGIGRDACGQWLHALCRYGYPGDGDLDTQLSRLWADFRLWCRTRKVPTSR